jgi:hypothetical protein
LHLEYSRELLQHVSAGVALVVVAESMLRPHVEKIV